MKKTSLAALVTLFLSSACFAQYSTPNIGLQIPPVGSNNWYVPLDYNFNKVDQMLSGNLSIPALKVTNNVTIGGSLTVGSIVGSSGNFVQAATANTYSLPYYSGANGTATFSGISLSGIPVFSTTGLPTAATSSTFANILLTATNCNQVGNYVYNPYTNSCIVASSGASGAAGGDLSGTYPGPTVASVHATSGTLAGITSFAATGAASFTGGVTANAITVPGFTTSGQCVVVGASGALVSQACPGASATPGGTNLQLQFNNNGALGGLGISTDAATHTNLTGVGTFSGANINGLISSLLSGSALPTLAQTTAVDSHVIADNPNMDRLGYTLSDNFAPVLLVGVANPLSDGLLVTDERNGVSSRFHYNWDGSRALQAATNQAGGDTCLRSNDATEAGSCIGILDIERDAGFDLGTGPGGADGGWDGGRSFSVINASSYAGIHNGFLMQMEAHGIGDENPLELQMLFNPGWVDGSGEGVYDGFRIRTNEGTPATGVVGSTSAQGTDTIVNITSGNNLTNLGVGQYLLDTTYSVLTGTSTLNTGGSPTTPAVLNTGATTVPVSASCVLNAGVSITNAPLNADEYATETVTCNTTVDLSSHVGQKMAFEDGMYDFGAMVTAAAALNTTTNTQALTVNVRHNHNSGVQAWIGGEAGTYYVATAFDTLTSGWHYAFPISGSPTSTTIRVGEEIVSTFSGNGVPIGAFTIYHGCSIGRVLYNPGSGTVLCAGNETGLWAANDNVAEGLQPAQQYGGPMDESRNIEDPMAIATGISLTLTGNADSGYTNASNTWGFRFVNNAGGPLQWGLALMGTQPYNYGVWLDHTPNNAILAVGSINKTTTIFQGGGEGVFDYVSIGNTEPGFHFGLPDPTTGNSTTPIYAGKINTYSTEDNEFVLVANNGPAIFESNGTIGGNANQNFLANFYTNSGSPHAMWDMTTKQFKPGTDNNPEMQLRLYDGNGNNPSSMLDVVNSGTGPCLALMGATCTPGSVTAPSMVVAGSAVCTVASPCSAGNSVPVTTVAASGTTQTLTFGTSGDIAYDITLSANCTISLTTPTGTGSYKRVYLIIHPNGYQVTLPASSSSLAWQGGAAPSPGTSATAKVTFSYDGAMPVLGGN